MLQTWKVPHLIKGSLTSVPVLNAWRGRRATTGGSDSARYCYSVWFRHLVRLNSYGFKVAGMRIGELGPGDSIGAGLAALLSGASQYVGLDIFPFSVRAELATLFDDLVDMFLKKEPIPDNREFPHVRPSLCSYEFPERLIEWTKFMSRVEGIRAEIEASLTTRSLVTYRAPWSSPEEIARSSLDLIFSQAVLEHVDELEQVYRSMFLWLKPGGWGFHVIDFSAHHLSPFWNGHWAYSNREWKLVRGHREFLLNREPLSSHLALAQEAGFHLVAVERVYSENGCGKRLFIGAVQNTWVEDAETQAPIVVLRKPRPTRNY